MELLNFILNIAALLLWLNARAPEWARAGRSLPPSGFLVPASKAGSPHLARWASVLAMVGIIVLRSLFYSHAGSLVYWTPTLEIGPIAIPFRSDLPGRMLLFSVLSCLKLFWLFYSALFLLSILGHNQPAADPFERLLRWQIGRLDRLPRIIKALMPAILGAAGWLLVLPLLVRSGLFPQPGNTNILAQLVLISALTSFVSWVYVIIAVLGLHVIQTYVHLGNSPFWGFISRTAERLLKPMRVVPMTFAKIDPAPVLMGALVFAAARIAMHGFTGWYHRLSQQFTL